MPPLTSADRQALRARAHALNPVVAIAESGLTSNVLAEIDRSLTAHELIKIRVFGDSREDRQAHLEKICLELKAEPVQHIGKLLVIFRHSPEKAEAEARKATKSRNAPRRTKRSFQG